MRRKGKSCDLFFVHTLPNNNEETKKHLGGYSQVNKNGKSLTEFEFAADNSRKVDYLAGKNVLSAGKIHLVPFFSKYPEFIYTRPMAFSRRPYHPHLSVAQKDNFGKHFEGWPQKFL